MREYTLCNARSILVVRLDGLGDVILTSPFLRELRRNAPTARITLVVSPSVFNLVELCPYADEILAFPGWHPAYRYIAFCARHLWIRNWDFAISPRFDVDYFGVTRLLRLSRAKRRVGYSEHVTKAKARSNAGFDGRLTDLIYADAARHEVLHNLDVLRKIGGEIDSHRLELWLSQDDERTARMRLERFAGSGRRLFAILPAASERKRIWPIESFAEVARRLCEEFDCNFAIVGGQDAFDFGARIGSELGDRVLNLAGQLTIRQSAALLQNCALTITNDSGPMHLAAAAGSHLVAVSCHPATGEAGHFNSPLRFGPWGPASRTLQPAAPASPCQTSCTETTSHCIRGVTPKEVLDAVRDLWDTTSSILHPKGRHYRVAPDNNFRNSLQERVK